MKLTDFTPNQYNYIKSTVGINYNVNQQGNFYRNRFLINENHPNFHEIEELMAKGIVEELKPAITIPFFQFKLTDKGLDIAKQIEEEIFNN